MTGTARRQWTARVVLVSLGLGVATACGNVNVALERLSQARRLAADASVEFLKAADAGNRSVMADTDDASVAFAHEAEQAKEAVQRDVTAIEPILTSLGHPEDVTILREFETRFVKYQTLDRTILDLAVENTNLKAQRLSFGPGQEAAEAFSTALEGLAPRAPADAWRVQALVANAVASVRGIQVLQAPHIAESTDAVMARLEAQMSAEMSAAKSVLETLATLVEVGSKPQLAAADAALDRFADVNTQLLALSHRNTNVRSLALSLDQKRPLTMACEDSLRQLRDALAKRGVTSGR